MEEQERKQRKHRAQYFNISRDPQSQQDADRDAERAVDDEELMRRQRKEERYIQMQEKWMLCYNAYHT